MATASRPLLSRERRAAATDTLSHSASADAATCGFVCVSAAAPHGARMMAAPSNAYRSPDMPLHSGRSGNVERILADAVAVNGERMAFERRLHDRVRRLRPQIEHADRHARQIQRRGAHRGLELVELLFGRPSSLPD